MSDNAVLHSRDSGVTRLTRGWAVAVVAVLLAAGGHQAAHSLMHGATEALPWELLGFSAALTAPIAVALAGKRLQTWATAATTVFAQVAFHLLYSLPYSGAHGAHGGHPEHPAVGQLTHAAGAHPAMVAEAVMVVSHLLAAALTTAVIVFGERSLGRILSWLTLAPVRVVLATRPVHVTKIKPVPMASRGWIPHPMNVVQTRYGRGPPVLA